MPLPTITEDLLSHLWGSEEPIGRTPHYTLQPRHSVRFATSVDAMETKIIDAGFRGPTHYKVAVVDALDNHYTVNEYAYAGRPDPEP